ncbi:MAG: BrnT family toxin [Eubacterium sp.]|nr:BrnT family toxin [Eubacterium sp.]
MTQLEFEWDEEKELANIKKHNVDFRMAGTVLLDVNRVELFDADHSYSEERFITIGLTSVEGKDEILTVIYTVRNGKVRIISARIASTEEKELYYG